jgi:hypothetical protein
MLRNLNHKTTSPNLWLKNLTGVRLHVVTFLKVPPVIYVMLVLNLTDAHLVFPLVPLSIIKKTSTFPEQDRLQCLG